MGYNWETITTEFPSVELKGLDAGTYEVEVVAINGVGLESTAATTRISVAPQEYIPEDPTNLSISPIDEFTGLLSWNQASDVRVYVGGKVLINHSPVASGATWDESTSLINNVSGGQSAAVVPLLEGTYLIKFSTNENIRSSVAATTSIVLSEPDPLLTIATIQEDASNFPGTGSSLVYDAIKDGLALEVGSDFDSFAPDGEFDELGPIDSLGGVKPTGEYYFSSIVDAGAVCDVNLIRRLKVEPYNVALTFDDNVGEIDTWGDFDGNDVTDANATLYVRATNNDPTSASIDSFPSNIDTWTDFDFGFASWTEWRICTNNLLRGRAFQFKAVATSEQVSQNIVIKELGVTAKLRQRIERSASVITSGAAMYQVNFVNNFHAAPAVSICPVQTSTGDYYTIAAITNSGFQVTFYDSGANIVSRDFNYTAVGYGRRF